MDEVCRGGGDIYSCATELWERIGGDFEGVGEAEEGFCLHTVELDGCEGGGESAEVEGCEGGGGEILLCLLVPGDCAVSEVDVLDCIDDCDETGKQEFERVQEEGGKHTQSCLGKLETEFGDIVPVSSVILLERFAIEDDIREFGDMH